MGKKNRPHTFTVSWEKEPLRGGSFSPRDSSFFHRVRRVKNNQPAKTGIVSIVEHASRVVRESGLKNMGRDGKNTW